MIQYSFDNIGNEHMADDSVSKVKANLMNFATFLQPTVLLTFLLCL